MRRGGVVVTRKVWLQAFSAVLARTPGGFDRLVGPAVHHFRAGDWYPRRADRRSELELPSAWPAGMRSSTCRHRCTRRTKPSRSAADHTTKNSPMYCISARRVAGDRAGLEQRLELPGLRRMAAPGGWSGAHARLDLRLGRNARASTGQKGAFGGVVGADPDQVRGERCRPGRRFVVATFVLPSPRRRRRHIAELVLHLPIAITASRVDAASATGARATARPASRWRRPGRRAPRRCRRR